ncbi:MAG: type II secretion system protein [Planctomycetes bacterium]|nr:type II secretion system protein [Planctomycetota bacterium]
MAHRKSKAFTLVELLVVIAIISILAGLLLPALKNSLDMARSIKCLNSLKMLELGSHAYSDSYDGWVVPVAYKWDGSGYAEKMEKPSSILYKSFAQILETPDSIINSGKIGATTAAYICPSATGIWEWNANNYPNETDPKYDTDPKSFNFTYSYSANSGPFGLYGAAYDPLAIKSTKIKHPSRLSHFMDGLRLNVAKGGSWYSAYANSYANNLIERHTLSSVTCYRHNEGAGVGFYDGHATRIHYSQFEFNADYWDNN